MVRLLLMKVLLIGLRANAVNYTKWPDLSPEKLEAAFANVTRTLEAAGYSARWCLTDAGPTASVEVQEALRADPPELVLIGAGLRTDPELLFLFEQILNVVHAHAPAARICFNSSPFDSVEAVKRWS